jgi:DNA-3-methyladenine glycosylase
VEIPIGQVIRESVILPSEFYSRPAVEVARDCLGKILIHGETAGRIVEVEAYLGLDDLAAHSSRGITPRTRVIFGAPGHAYVYFIYGMYECLNFVAEPEGSAGCVLIRALEPMSGVDGMWKRRPAAKKLQDLASGPGRLTRAMGISRELNGSSLTDGPLQVRRVLNEEVFQIQSSPRIGISKCAELPLRFFIGGNPCVSRLKASGNPS